MNGSVDDDVLNLIDSLPEQSINLAQQTVNKLNACLARVIAESSKQSSQSTNQSIKLALSNEGATNAELVELERLIRQYNPSLNDQSTNQSTDESEDQPVNGSDRVAEMMRRLGLSSAYEAAKSSHQSNTDQSTNDQSTNDQSNSQSTNQSTTDQSSDHSDTKFALPPSYLAFLSQHDGQSFDSENLIGNFNLLSVHRIKTEYQNLCEMNQYDMFKTENQSVSQLPTKSKRVQPTWYDNGWIPIAQSNFGHFICIDLNPVNQPTSRSTNQSSNHATSQRSNKGQLIFYQIDAPQRPVIANSWIDFFESFIQSINQSIDQSINRFSADQSMWIGDGSEGFHGVWLEGSSEFAARRENQISAFDETTLNQLCAE